MELTADERALLDGTRGEAARMALESQIAVGTFFGAERFVEVSNVHMMGDYEVMGDAGYAYVRRLLDLGARVTVPTSRNAQCIDYDFAERLRQGPVLVERERDVRRGFGELRISVVDTCINYQTVYTPRFGEHVAWGDTGTVAYANSVLGARTNYESGPAAIAAAITGRTPAYGYHLDENRRANSRVCVTAALRDLADYGALGAVVGERVRGYWNVPYIELTDANPTPDDLKHLGASLASFGSLAMYHVAGITPEARDWQETNGGRAVGAEFTVTQRDIDQVYSRGVPADGRVNLVVFTAPQLSPLELSTIADAFDGRTKHAESTVIVTTNAQNYRLAEMTGTLAALQNSGVFVLQGVCWYIMDPAEMKRQFGWSRVCTNSAKLMNIIKVHGYEPVLRRTRDCVEAAVTGRLA